jgi:hypothetical protein
LWEQKKYSTFVPANEKGAIAQLVEQRTENPCVPCSIQGGTTFKKMPIPYNLRSWHFLFDDYSLLCLYNYLVAHFHKEQDDELIARTRNKLGWVCELLVQLHQEFAYFTM